MHESYDRHTHKHTHTHTHTHTTKTTTLSLRFVSKILGRATYRVHTVLELPDLVCSARHLADHATDDEEHDCGKSGEGTDVSDKLCQWQSGGEQSHVGTKPLIGRSDRVFTHIHTSR
jgi:hypothetical protein